jgi:hypothetical protein
LALTRPWLPTSFLLQQYPNSSSHLFSLIQLEMAARVKDRALVAAGAGAAETRVVATMLLAEATKARAVRPVLPSFYNP